MAHEYAPSVAARRAWEAKVQSDFEQPPLWDDRAEPAPLTDREREHRKARAALEELQGTPQTFWERNGTGDEYPLPEGAAAQVVTPTAAQPEPEPAGTAPASATEVAAFICANASTQLTEASKAFARGDSSLGLEMVALASGALSSIAPVIGSVASGR
jgi:hypothetical protein